MSNRAALVARSPWSRRLEPGAPPGPRGLPVVGSAVEYMLGPLAFVTRVARRYGPVASIDMGGLPFYAVSDPALIHQVMSRQSRHFVKGRLDFERRLLFGQGLATSDGDTWKRQRAQVRSAFSSERFAGYAATTAELVDRGIATWPTERPVDLHPLIMRLALDVVSRVLLGANVARASEVGERLETLLGYYGRQSNFVLRLLPRQIPRPGRTRFHRAVADLDRIVLDMIARRRAASPGPDLSSALIAARDDDDQAMSDRELRDQLMTLFLAGHETTALTLSWTCGLLAQHPEVERTLARELFEVLGDRRPSLEDLPRLAYAAAVIKESMRLYPPAWILAREVATPTELGGFELPAGSYVTVSQWVMHRDRRYFRDPLCYRPERWLGDLESTLPRGVYFPFGGGPRACIGARFATMEALITLAAVVRRFRFRPRRGLRLEPVPSLSLRPKTGIRGTLIPRHRRQP